MHRIVTMAVLIATGQGVALAAPIDSTSMREVVVTGTRSQADLRHLPSTVTVVGRDALMQDGRRDIMSTLSELVPGMLVTRRGVMGYGVSTGAAGGIGMRGLNSSSGQMMVLIDGHPQYNSIYSHAMADCYRTLMTERVEVLRGPASMLYGSNAMGGVVNIVTRKSKEDGVRSHLDVGAGSYGTVQAEGSTQVRKGAFSSTVGAQYGRSDNHRPDMEFEDFGGFAKFAYELSSHWTAQANIDVTHWNASNPGPVTARLADNDQHITRGASTINIDNDYGNTSGGMSFYCSWGRHRINDGYAIDGGKPQSDYFRSKDAMAGGSVWQTVKLCSGNRMTTGIDFQCMRGHAFYTDMKTGEVVTTDRRKNQSTDRHLYSIAGYLDLRQELNRWLTLDAGVRFDHHSITGGEWIPQAGLAYRPTRGGELKATVGKGFRNPSMRELFLYGSRNTGLEPERLVNYELAWHQKLHGGRLAYGVNLFAMKGDGIIMTLEGRNVNSGEIDNVGLEVDAHWTVDQHWRLSTNHSFMHMEHHLAYTPQYKGYLQATCHYGRWDVTAHLQQLCGLYTVKDGAYASDAGGKENVSLLSATVSCLVAPGITLWLNGENLLACRYEYVAGYPMPRATAMTGVRLQF